MKLTSTGIVAIFLALRREFGISFRQVRVTVSHVNAKMTVFKSAKLARSLRGRSVNRRTVHKVAYLIHL